MITERKISDFEIQTIQDAVSTLSTITSGITLLLVALVCISLVVGGVGIMNIMYVSVAERTFEIGLRKSLGARSKDVLWQFLVEAILITIGGGIVGVQSQKYAQQLRGEWNYRSLFIREYIVI
jgi:putative ABC transport system permease protein